VYDDVTQEVYTKDYVVKLPDGIIIPEVCVKIHGITNERMREEGADIKVVLEEFTRDWMKCNILIAHNLDFDNRVLQAEYHRNGAINWLGRHRKIEYCTMLYGKKFTNLMRKSKYGSGMWQKPPKLIELHEKLFKSSPKNLHNSLIDVLVCFRCYYKMVYDKDIVEDEKHPKVCEYFKTLCGL